MKVIAYKVGQEPTMQEIPNTLQGMQSFVGDFFICRENGDEFTDAQAEDIEKLGGIIQ